MNPLSLKIPLLAASLIFASDFSSVYKPSFLSGAKHGFKDGLADYHIPNPTNTNLIKYFVQRSAVFFQTIMMYNITNGFSSHPPFEYAGTSTYFYNTENSRINVCPE